MNPVAVVVVVVIGLGVLKSIRSAMNGSLPELFIVLAIVGLLVFGVGWEVAECVTGQQFGDPGDGSNPFDRVCTWKEGGG